MEFTDFSTSILIFLFITAIVASFLDTLAGGGGLITVPALIVSGVPPLAVLGTNKFQSSMGTATATFMMFKNKKVSWKEVGPLMLMAFIGSAIGAFTVQRINTEALSFIIPVVLVFIAIYFLFAPQPKETDGEPKLSYPKYKNIVVPIIGSYDGFFGPGTGSFFALAGVSLRGQGLISATIVAKTLNFATNVAALLVFLTGGKIAWIAGIVMIAGQAIGATLGSKFLFKINPAYLRTLIVIMCLSMLIRYSFAMGWVNLG
jgi:uncharacterized membrane protein YfcA